MFASVPDGHFPYYGFLLLVEMVKLLGFAVTLRVVAVVRSPK